MKEKLVEKLFHGTSTKEELEMLFQIIKQDPTPPAPELMERLWKEMEDLPELNAAVSDRILYNALNRIEEKKEKLPIGLPEDRWRISLNTRRRKIAISLSIAAGVLLLVIAGIKLSPSSNTPTIIQTAFGERQTLELSDGSVVELNANSQMIYDQEWSDEVSREIRLEGEAFFKVEKKPLTGQKLKVITNDLTVEVLGTTFNVNSKGEKTSVYLEEGVVWLYLRSLDSIVVMEPGDLVIYSEKTGQITRKQKEMKELYTSWKDGVLTFEESTLREVLQKIEDIYGIEFVVVDPGNNNREITFPLPIDELETTLSILEKTMLGLEIRKENNLYIIE